MPDERARRETGLRRLERESRQHAAAVTLTSAPPFAAPYAPPDEEIARRFLLDAARDAGGERRIDARAGALIRAIRAGSGALGGIEDFLREYSLSTKEGLALMVLAEALLRVPDAATADKLIEDKLAAADWSHHETKSSALLVSASAWALGITARIVQPGETPDTILEDLAKRLGRPAVRAATRQAMRLLGSHFVMGQTIEEALARAGGHREFRYSFDMLGEGARTADDAARYFESYAAAIDAIGTAAGNDPLPARPGISVKLSALHPRYEAVSRERVLAELPPRLLDLARQAKAHDLNFTVDAEEADRLELSLEVIAAALADPSLSGWDGFGLAIQAYQKRAPQVIDWTLAAAESLDRRLMVRLVKGAYWDTEVKRAQERGLADYPVFTRKAMTDLCYMACLRAAAGGAAAHLPAIRDPQRAHRRDRDRGGRRRRRATNSSACTAWERRSTMRCSRTSRTRPAACMRRSAAIATCSPTWCAGCWRTAPTPPSCRSPPTPPCRSTRSCGARSRGSRMRPMPAIRTFPARRSYMRRYGAIPPESSSASVRRWKDFSRKRDAARSEPARAAPLVNGIALAGARRPVVSPIDGAVVGEVVEADEATVRAAMRAAAEGFRPWADTPVERRAAALERASDMLEANRGRLIALLAREGGKTLDDALAEVREAVDFCRYYAAEARRALAPERLPGPTGEIERAALSRPRRVPVHLAVEFSARDLPRTGGGGARRRQHGGRQAGRADAADRGRSRAPAARGRDSADGTAPRARRRRCRSGARSPPPGRRRRLHRLDRGRLGNQPRAGGQGLGPIVPLIAETGGINAMIVDATALPEQVTDDVVTSAFRSAGQRCSALRLICVQDDVADRMIAMIDGAARELAVGDPREPATHVGPVIDQEAKARLDRWIADMEAQGRVRFRWDRERALPSAGTYVPPTIVELDWAADLKEEVFGPILHVVRWRADALERVLDEIAANAYGLTLGVHSRIDSTVQRVVARLPHGNVYVNRSIIGAVVGTQPFGGTGLSGTGPKAGGPNYLRRFATEQTVTINTAAAGGNASLLAEPEE